MTGSTLKKDQAAIDKKKAEQELKKKEAEEKAKQEALLKAEAAKTDPKLAFSMKKQELIKELSAKSASTLTSSRDSRDFALKLQGHDLSDKLVTKLENHTRVMEAVLHRHDLVSNVVWCVLNVLLSKKSQQHICKPSKKNR